MDREDRVETYLQISGMRGHIYASLLFQLSLTHEVGDRITLLKSGRVPPIMEPQQLSLLTNEGTDKFDELEFPYETRNLINPLTPRRTLVAPFTKISILF